MKVVKIFLLLMLVIAPMTAMAQYPRVTIEQIQTVPLGQDSSLMCGDTVQTGGIITAGTAAFYSGSGVTFYMEDPDGGPFSGIMVYNPDSLAIPPLVRGDSVLLTAVVSEYISSDVGYSVVHTELFNVPGQFSFQMFGLPEPEPLVVTAAVLDSAQDDSLFHGEPYESVFIRINNLICDTVVDYGTTATWLCHDATGHVCVREASSQINGFRPNVGTEFEFVQGVVYHRFGAYQLQPRYMTDMPLAAGAPTIGNVSNTPEFPLVGELVTISANVFDDTHVDTTRLYYRINNAAWANEPMIDQGNNLFTFQLPSPQANWKVDYYFRAVDNDHNTRTLPYEAPSAFFTYIVQNPRQMTIAEAKIDANFDFVPDKSDTAAILTGVVTTPNFSTRGTSFFIQQGDAGINVYWDSSYTVIMGDSMTINGVIGQGNGITEIRVFDRSRMTSNGPGHIPDTTVVTCSELINSGAEAYEGRLVRLNNVKIIPGPDPWPLFGLGATMGLIQGTDTASMYISVMTDIDGTTQGDTIASIVGVLNQYDLYSPYDGYYEFDPRSLSDFTWGYQAPVGCPYILGDINENGSPDAVDVTYGVNYLKGRVTPHIDCAEVCPGHGAPFFASGDVNGSCEFNGIDITFFVNYLKGRTPALITCADCPPATMIAKGSMPQLPVLERPAVVPSLKAKPIDKSRGAE